MDWAAEGSMLNMCSIARDPVDLEVHRVSSARRPPSAVLHGVRNEVDVHAGSRRAVARTWLTVRLTPLTVIEPCNARYLR